MGVLLDVGWNLPSCIVSNNRERRSIIRGGEASWQLYNELSSITEFEFASAALLRGVLERGKGGSSSRGQINLTLTSKIKV